MTTTPATIDDLSKGFPEATIGTRWQLVSDAVMGGVSSGQMTRVITSGRPAIRIHGIVRLENNGGFLQIALDLATAGAVFDASGFSGIALDVLGNGDEYGLHLRTTDLNQPWQSYRHRFVADPVWTEIHLPFANFLPHRTDAPLDIRKLRRLGIVAIGRAFEADLSAAGLRLY